MLVLAVVAYLLTGVGYAHQMERQEAFDRDDRAMWAAFGIAWPAMLIAVGVVVTFNLARGALVSRRARRSVEA